MSLLSVDSIEKIFGDLKAVDGVSLHVNEGEIYGLLGPNGAGKTTLISVISGLIRATAGSVTVAGQPFWSDPRKAQALMGVVPQEIALYEELSGRENLVFWGRMAGLPRAKLKQRAHSVLEALALKERSNDRVKTYSGGMKRRINLGCALMHEPRLLLLDEPTVGIDPQARVKILDFVKTLTQGGTAVLYTTHYLEEAETLCDRVGIIDRGKLLAEGNLGELQELTGAKQLFLLEGEMEKAAEALPPAFHQRYKILQNSERQLTVVPLENRHPSECLRELLDLPLEINDITVKKPTLNEVFLKLTGRQLRE